MFRVTVNTQIDRSLFDITNTTARLQTVQEQISSGKRMAAPSDDPTGNARAMVLNNTISQNTQFMANMDNAKGFVSVEDSASQNYVNALQSLRQLAVQGANGTLQPSDKAAISNQIAQIREQIRSIGNTQFDGRYIYGGIKTDQQPYPADVTLSPNDKGTLLQQVAPGTPMPYNITGVQMFGDTTPGNTNNIFSVIDNFSTLLAQNTSTTAISTQTIAQVDDWLKTASNNRTTLGGWSNRLDQGKMSLQNINTNLSQLLSNVTDTDIAQASLTMNQTQATLQAALQVGAQAMPLSLVNFLK